MSKPFGLLGEKLRHSYSPLIHSLLADYEYRLFEVPPDSLADFLGERGFAGLNVTIPYKTAVIPFCDILSDIAQRTESVNTILIKNGNLIGENTDYYGFLYLIKKSGIKIKGKKVCVLGSGGSSKTVCTVLRDLGAAETVIISRSGDNNYGNLSLHSDASVIVNTTPVGMYPSNGRQAAGLNAFPRCEGVIDLIYNPAKTALLLEAERSGIVFANGLSMLTAQAKRSAELFCDIAISDTVIDEITRKISFRMKNIVLVGMPGSGKSTLGQIIADETGREFIDTDNIITEREGRTPAAIINDDGEDTFRTKESAAVSYAGSRSGCVIATGGGVVTRRENFDALRQNGIVVFINRPPENLASGNRPLSAGGPDALNSMLKARLPLYRQICDIEIDGDGSIDDVISRLRSGLRDCGLEI